MNSLASNEGLTEVKHKTIWSFRDLLSWKIPEDLASTNVNLSRSRVEAEYLPPPICLYKFNLVTQRIKEQRTHFVGIVTHVKQGNWKDGKHKPKDNDDGSKLESS